MYKNNKQKTKKKYWKERKKITEVKRTPQSTTQNRTPKAEKLSGTLSKKKKKLKKGGGRPEAKFLERTEMKQTAPSAKKNST